MSKSALVALVFFVTSHVSWGQKDCSFSVEENISICEPQTVFLKATGNTEDIQWYDAQGVIFSTKDTVSVAIESDTTLYVINKIPFGTELINNGDFEGGNVGFSSDYFESCVSGVMPQGAYCITDSSGWFHPGWSNCKSRTGTGKMLVSDGAVVPNESIWCQNVSVEQNKDYAFSAWVTSLINAGPPVIQFSINGELLGEPITVDNNPCDWKEFFQVWESGNTTNAEICIVNQSNVGQGNDFAIDDISLRETCFQQDSIKIKVVDEIDVDLGPDTTFCAGDDYTLANLSPNVHAGLNYIWSNGDTSTSITITSPESYFLKVVSEEGCTGSDTISLSDLGFPINTLPEDSTVCFTAFPTIALRSGDALHTTWAYDGIEESTDELMVSKAGSYQFTLSNGEHCATRFQIDIENACSHNLFLPSAFTPNADGINDSFGPYSMETYDFEFKIYNRWGELIFEGKDVNDRWDGTTEGKHAPGGVYVYFIQYTVVDIDNPILRSFTKSGRVSLVR